MSQVAHHSGRIGMEGDPDQVSRSVPTRVIAAVVSAQFAAAAIYVALMVLGEAPAPFSIGAWAFMLLPPLVFGVLFVTGLFIAGLARRSLWKVVLTVSGCLVSMCGLVVTVLLVPLMLFGFFADYTIG